MPKVEIIKIRKIYKFLELFKVTAKLHLDIRNYKTTHHLLISLKTRVPSTLTLPTLNYLLNKLLLLQEENQELKIEEGLTKLSISSTKHFQ